MAKTEKASVAIIAGGETAGTKLEGSGARLKALIDIGGEPMLAKVVRAACSAPLSGEVAVIGPPELEDVAASEGAKLYTPSEDSFLANLQVAASVFSQYPLILVSSCDIPLVSPQGLNDFIKKGLASGADFCYSIVRQSAVDEAFPGGQRTVVRLQDGSFTGGNAVLVTPEFLQRESALIEQTFEARKSVLKMLRILGLPFALRFVLGRLTIEMLERRASEILKCTAKAIVSEDPALAFDVDKMADLDDVRAYLARHSDSMASAGA